MGKKYIPDFTDSQKEKVIKKLNPISSRACNNNLFWSPNQESYSGNYYGYSLKRSKLNHCNFKEAIFDHTSFAGSILNDLTFSNDCKFESVYLENCVLTNVLFSPNINNCSFFHSYIKDCSFNSKELRGNHFDGCYIDNCLFENCKIRATIFDGSYILNSNFKNCNMNNLNIEFASIQNCTFDGSSVSYFQLPYIIGVFDNITPESDFSVSLNQKQISIFEYFKNIDESIIYFTSLQEFFPLANLYYVIGKKDIAYNCLEAGINHALRNNNIRMVENYCKLGQFYNLIQISDIQRFLKNVDKRVESQRQSSMYHVLLIQAYRLKASLAENTSKSKLEITVNTNITEANFQQVGVFCQELDNIILTVMSKKVTTSYQLSHNSPFEICITCVGITADLVTVSGFIYSYISRRMTKKPILSQEVQDYIENSNKMFIQSLHNQFDSFESLMDKTQKSQQKPIIEDFRGKIISATVDQITKDFSLIVSQ
ncbi:MAG: pentapeptide repeat-containing protein [Candidatus Gracilibacteria bacterium]|nr:pentapeptide repeat-containing protein [Candidatus Gracilibacteria bacterium]